jgi:geranylgeranyl pyrophosphate synthase
VDSLGKPGVTFHLLTHITSLENFEDGSSLRRGKPAAHKIFGAPQTINSANFAIIEAIKEARQLDIPEAVEIVLGKHRNSSYKEPIGS